MGGSWSYAPNDKYKSARQLIHTLADIVSKGGNLLLNIGPGPDGKWDPQAYERLKEIGSWIKINGEAIYGTRGMERFAEGKFRFTQGQNGKYYAIYLAEEGNRLPEKIVISSLIPSERAFVRLLGTTGEVRWEKCDNGTIIHLPKSGTLPSASSYAWVLSFSGFQKAQ
jgi:alpha-L-fucosidase